MLSKEIAIETARNFIRDLKTAGYNPTEAWLFGSVVNGNINSYSDIDLALWDKKFIGVPYLDAENIKMLLLKYKLIELHSYYSATTEKEDPFVGEIKKTGEKIL